MFERLEPFIEDKLRSISIDRRAAMNLYSVIETYGNMELAKSLLDLTTEAHPRLAPARNALGCVLAKEGSLREALGHFSAAVKQEPGNTLYLKNMGLACERLGLTKQALTCYPCPAGRDPESVWYARQRILAIRAGLGDRRGMEMRKAGGDKDDTYQGSYLLEENP